MEKNEGLLKRLNINQQYDRLKIRTEKLIHLHEIGRRIIKSPEIEKIYTNLVEAGLFITKSEEGRLLLVDEDSIELFEVAHKSSSDRVAKLEKVKVKDNIIGSVVVNRKPIRKNKVLFGTAQLTRGFIAVPLTSKDNILGVLVVYNLSAERQFNDEDEYCLLALADYASAALDNFKLIDKARTLSSLSKVSQSLLTTYDLNNDLNHIAYEAFRVLDADVVLLYKYDLESEDVIIPPIIKGDLLMPEHLQLRGKLHKDAIIFKLIKNLTPIYAQNAKEDWIRAGYYTEELQKTSFVEREGILSSVGVPLVINKTDPVGMLFVNYRKKQTFSLEFRDKLDLFANYAALVLHNLDIHNKAKEYAQQLSVLNEIGQTTSASVTLEPESIFSLIHKEAGRVMEFSNFYIALYDNESKVLEFKLVIERGQKIEPGDGEWKSRKNGNGLTEYVIKSREPLLLTKNIGDWLRKHNIDVIGELAKSWLGAPMIVSGKVIGAIATQDFEMENKYTKKHKDIFNAIATQAAIAIENSFLVYRLNGYINGLEKLNELGKGILSRESIEDILNNAARAASELTNGDLSAILLFRHLDKENIFIESCWSSNDGIDASQFIGFRVPLNSGVTGKVATTQEPLIVPDVLNFKGYIKIIPSTRSEIAIPLLHNKNNSNQATSLLGVINVESNDVGHFNQFHKDLLIKLGTQVAIALEQTNRVQELERVQQYLQDASSLANIGFVYGEDLHLANNKLGAARQFAINILEFNDVIQIKDYAKRIYKNIDDFLDILDELREIINPPSVEKFDLHEQLIATVYSINKSSLITVLYKFGNISPMIIGYKRQISQVFRVVIFNAIKAMEGAGSLTISTNEIVKNEEKYVEVRIKDTGKGIPKSIRPFIFTPGRASNSKRGIGMGLPWSKMILRITGGDISFDTEINEGTTFKILLPRDSQNTAFDITID